MQGASVVLFHPAPRPAIRHRRREGSSLPRKAEAAAAGAAYAECMRWVRPTRTDLISAGVVTAFGVVSVLATSPGPGTGIVRDADALGVALGVMSTAPIALRRWSPFGVLLVTGAGIVLASAWGYSVAAAGLGPILATTSAAYLSDRRGAITAGATIAMIVFGATALAFRGQSGGLVELTTTLAIVVLATVVGDVLRTLRERNRELEALRDAAAREAVAQDRIRIARDVHDVVGHVLAGITLQARAGRRLLDRDPERTADILRLIDELATQALGDTREAVGRIRDSDPQSELLRQPQLRDLDELVARLQGGDLKVQLRREGDASHVPAAVQASVYRIAQEALSNVVKHARPATAVVRLAAADGVLELDVRDDGRRAPADDGRGHGVRGMRERAALAGGSFTAGPDPDGGWTVSARLPVDTWPA